jgi:hypothetical protein
LQLAESALDDVNDPTPVHEGADVHETEVS